MWELTKTAIFTILVIGCIATLPRQWRRYKETKDKLDLLETVCKIILIPCGIILLINCLITIIR